jgi:hypothetical protein
MSSPEEIERLRAEADYYHDRVALLRARRYRWGLGTSARLQALEQELARAEKRLCEARGARPPRRPATFN